VTDEKWVAIPRGKGKERKAIEAKADMAMLQMKDFLDAVRMRQQPGCTIADAYDSTTTVKLATIAYDTGAKVTWDAASEQIVGNAEAAKLLKREYRAPWRHPYES